MKNVREANAHQTMFEYFARYNVISCKGIPGVERVVANNLTWEEATKKLQQLEAENSDRSFGGTVFWRKLINEESVREHIAIAKASMDESAQKH